MLNGGELFDYSSNLFRFMALLYLGGGGSLLIMFVKRIRISWTMLGDIIIPVALQTMSFSKSYDVDRTITYEDIHIEKGCRTARVHESTGDRCWSSIDAHAPALSKCSFISGLFITIPHRADTIICSSQRARVS
jgi:hypothetical protein